jgi:hypothetical protein
MPSVSMSLTRSGTPQNATGDLSIESRHGVSQGNKLEIRMQKLSVSFSNNLSVSSFPLL